MAGWIKLHRKLLDWEWWGDGNTTRLWIYILLKANHKEKIWKGIKIEPGTFVTSFAKMAEETGLSLQQTRTAISNMEKSMNITRKATNKYQLVTVCNWAFYQGEYENPTSNSTGNQHATQQSNNMQPNNNQEVKNERSNNITPISPFEGRNFSPELQTEIENWIAYKNERREGYKPRGLQALLTQIENRQKQFTDEQIINLISECMARNYKGIIWDLIKPTERKWRQLD